MKTSADHATMLNLALFICLIGVATQQRRKLPDRPNIVLFITDDQDVQLGSMEYMSKTLQIFRHGGAEFVHGFVSTPICCPSRTTLLTGLYVHNHHVHSNKENCTGQYWIDHLEPNAFAVHLHKSGYRTGYFGKYLNEYNGSYVPPGWTEWMGLVKNSRFYNYTINYNGRRVKHGDQYSEDYFTDLVVNDSINFFKMSVMQFPRSPIMAVLSFPAPHGPEDPAPRYSKLYLNNTTHRTPSWNYAPNPDKQWLLRHTGKMEPVHVAFTDFLHRRRLQTLQSVDDAVAKLCKELKMMGEMRNTYMLYTSDHGYHLGQFGLIKGKTLPYEFDIRVPFFARGPNVLPGLRILKPVANIDIAPTILDMAKVVGVDAWAVDGRSLLPLLLDESHQMLGLPSTLKRPWRDTVLIERGVRPKLLKLRERLARQREKFSKEMRLQLECEKNEYQPPCKPGQLWECRRNELNRMRIFKCRGLVDLIDQCPCAISNVSVTGNRPSNATILFGRQRRHSGRLFRWEQAAAAHGQMAFVAEETLQGWEEQFFDFVNVEEVVNSDWYQGIFDQNLSDTELVWPKRSLRHARTLVDGGPGFGNASNGVRVVNGCVLYPNDTISCRPLVYNSLMTWKRQKLLVSDKIRTLRSRLQSLKGIRKHLKSERPTNSDSRRSGDTAAHCDCDVSPSPSDLEHPLKGHSAEELSESSLMQWLTGIDQSKAGRRKNEAAGKRRKSKAKQLLCNVPNLNCFTHDNSHWRTEPFWTLGPFCFCQNSYNNSYWCLRTVNETHNFLYCEFVTGFVSYYDLNADPFQLHNRLADIDIADVEVLSRRLDRLRRCQGAVDCELYSSARWASAAPPVG